ncbi:MAG: TIGR02099 family protein [Candidatus Accumulibacter sp.]|jgi:uncharacterized protein (TIGR02099 family)|nr:TIGR02099 family protein [Accumulibacter sp.]
MTLTRASVWRVFVRGFWIAYFLCILLILSLRYAILPHIENYRPAIERMLADGIGRQVSIGRIEAGWTGIHPDLTLYDVRLNDAEGRSALTLSRVEMVFSWWSVLGMRLRLLRIDQPTLHLRRDAEGRFFVAGLPLDWKNGDGGGGDASWLLESRRLRIDNATLIWEDETRDAPALVLNDAHVAFDNDGRRRRFGLNAQPPEALASRIDIRGDFRGRFDTPDEWRGEAFVEVDEADLAAWGRWVDHPLALPRGRGAIRAWLTFADGGPRELTADVVLREVNLRFAETLPALDIESASGRVQAKFPDDGFSVKGHRLALRARADDGEPIRIAPVDFEIGWRKGQGRESGAKAGRVEISHLELGALARLAAHLPLDAGLRQTLGEIAPRGQVSAFSARWDDTGNALVYSLKADARELGMRAWGNFPGFSGITGTLEANDTGGTVMLRSGESSLDLPTVFPESTIRLDFLNADANWKIDREGLAVELTRADFANSDATGSASGTYRTADDGPGIIDLSATLERADARAVWRYLPHVVDPAARRWLRDSLLAGEAAKARLTLKGKLKDFPFLDEGSGQFRVAIEARDVVLDYGADWPRIDGIAGDVVFAGSGMSIEARQGQILGARLSDTRARIPDFDAPLPVLGIEGRVDGPTAEFLKFIDQSPVAETIDRFTEGMRAVGNGHLDIELAIPLDEHRLDESRVTGVYHLTDNEVTVDDALPPLRQVNGSLRFSDDDLSVPEISASLFGGPLKIQGGLRKGGGVLITADGSADFDHLRQQSNHPLLARLSGRVPYHGEVRILGRNADILVESDLVGLASTLPEPFAKASGETLPLRFEKRLLPADRASGTVARDRLDLSLENLLESRIIRRKTPDGFAPERGAVAIGGRPLRVPETGLAFEVSTPRFDVDAWRELFDAASFGEPDENEAASVWWPDTIALRADDLSVRGLSWNDIELSAALAEKPWKIRIDSRQMKGDITWNGADGGQLVARLDRLIIDRLPSSSTTDATEIPDVARWLPALDVVAENFSVRKRDFGRLRVQASNDGTAWELERVEVSNPRGTLAGQGTWRHDGDTDQTRLRFQLDSSDVGGLLARLGYPGTVRDGSARMEGTLTWNGAPTEIDFASMHGDLKLNAARGQFLKIDPGAAGKLLGLISLQNLPRRISLDFKDVFSEGLAFDAIDGAMTVRNGIMRTRQLRIDSPSARVLMRGEVDLARETQYLDVTVQPEVGDTAAVGMAMVHPAVGVATWLANKVLRNPLGTVFGYHYRITGTWDDPKIEKLPAPAGGVKNEPETGS